MNLINEVDKPEVKKTVVIYAGRFQPFHKGHFDAYNRLCSKFGTGNVYIGTSDDQSSPKSPFGFKEKKEIATTMFGIPSSKFIKVNNPYKPVEILKKFDGKTTAYIAAVGEKDADRLTGKYFKPYKNKTGYGYDEIGYVYPVPAEANPISGTDVRKGLGSNDKEKAKKFFLKAYPKFDKDIFKMITTKLNEGFPGGIGVGLVLPGGYINGAPTGSVDESNNTNPSSKMRPEPHPTRHETEHPTDEPDWHKKNEPYSSVSEIIHNVVSEDLFQKWLAEYFEEDANPELDRDITYTNSKGQQKKIKARDALRLPKEHPAHILAAKIAGPSDAPVNEPKPKEEPGKAAQAAAAPSQPGQPVKQGQTAQGKVDKTQSQPKSTTNNTEPETELPNPQKLSGIELKTDAEKTKEKEDKKNSLIKKMNEKFNLLSNEQKSIFVKELKSKLSINENISESKQNSINRFVEYATKRLKLKETPKITLVGGKEYGNIKSSLGGYNPEDKTIYVATEGRLTADILRTLAHEMVHRKQDEMGYIKDSVKDGADGSPIENQAHAVAGILMREYGRINKQIYNEATDTSNHGDDGIHNNHNVSWKEYDNPAKGYVDALEGWEVYGHLSDEMPDEVLKLELPVNTHIDPRRAKGTNHLKETIKKVGDKYVVYPKNGGDRLGTHDSLASAKKQLAAIEINKEDVNIDVDKGDTVLMGKFKNKKVQVKNIGTDDHGMPTINGKQATTFRIVKDENINEMGSKDIHFKNVVTYYDKGGPNIKKQVGIVVSGNKYANRNRVVGDLRNMGYEEIKGIEKQLGIEDLFEKINLKEVSNNTGEDGSPDGGYLPKGKKRKLDKDKPEEWFTNGGYTQTDFPKADAIFGDEDAEERTVTYSIKNLPDVDYVKTKFIKEELLMEGGAYGHMSHPFDDMDLTFGDLKNIITNALNGDLGVVREKTDGQALAISWKNGRLIAARNKGNLANAGANAMGIEDVASKFAGRGGLTDAYNYAMKDLSAAISGLSEAQRKKIFNEGKCFMNLEVIWPTSVNVIPYGQALLVFHNTTCYDESGKAIGADGGAASTLAGMIKQINADVQSKYIIQGPPITSIPKSDDLSSRQGKYISKLKKLQSEFGLNDSDTIALYHQSYWENFIDKNCPTKIDKLTREALVRRWAFGDKSLRLNTISNPKLQEWAIDHDKVNVAKQQKENIKPFEEIFLGVGADVLEFVSSVLTVHPEKAIRSMKEKFKSVANQVRGSGDVSKIQKLKSELERLNQLGGIDKIVATEGLVFFYGGKTYKLTGTFAPLNQILGIFYS